MLKVLRVCLHLKQRANVANGDLETFSKGVPTTMSPANTKKLFDDIRSGMKMSKV